MSEKTVIFYSTHCPRCKALEMQLKQKNILFTEENDVEKMKALGLESAPGLEVDNKIMTFAEAMKWVREQ